MLLIKKESYPKVEPLISNLSILNLALALRHHFCSIILQKFKI
jgi:hypothetical protein